MGITTHGACLLDLSICKSLNVMCCCLKKNKHIMNHYIVRFFNSQIGMSRSDLQDRDRGQYEYVFTHQELAILNILQRIGMCTSFVGLIQQSV